MSTDLKCSHHNTSSLSDVHHEISACMPPVMGRSLPPKATPLIFGQLRIGFTGFSLSLCVMCSLTVFQVTSREVGVFKPRSSDSRVCVLEATPNSWFLLASSVAFSWTVLHPAPKSDLVKMQMDPVYVTSLHETLQWLLPGFRFNKAPLPVPTGSPTWSPVASLWTSAPSHQLLASLGSLHLLGFAEPCPCLALHKPASFSAFRDTFSGMPALIPPTLQTSLCGLDSLLAWVTAPCWCPLSQPHNLPPFPFIGWFPCLWPSSPTSLWAPRGEGACSSLCPTPSNQHNAWPIAGN